MQVKFGYVLLFVENIERSIAFYTLALGLPLRFHDGHYAEMETGATSLGFVSREFAATQFPHPMPAPGLSSSEIGLVVARADVDTLYEQALAGGATSVLAPLERPWSQRVSYVRDPDGHLVEICSPIGQ